MPLAVARSPSTASLSPMASNRKATAVFRKRRRDWSDHDDRAEPDGSPSRRHWPLAALERQRPSSLIPPTSSWSSPRLSPKLDASDPPSLYGEIQATVDYVGSQIARAQRDVAELRELLRQAMRPPETMAMRVRIDRLCS